MSTYNNINELFTDICNSLRTKLGITESIKHSDIASKILEIQSVAEVSIEYENAAYNVKNATTANNKLQEISDKMAKNPNIIFSLKNAFASSYVTNANNYPLARFFDASKMFYNNTTAILQVSNLNTSETVDMNNMFFSNYNLKTLDVSNWDTSKVIDMNSMFYNCNGLTSLNVSNWKTSNVTNMKQLFYNCINLTTLDVSNFDTSKVTNMNNMFGSCRVLTTLDVSNWDTSNVTNMGSVFYNCNGLTSLNVSNWNTSKVTNMSMMFNCCDALTTLDVSNWDVSKVLDMTMMFNGCDALTTLDLSNWDMSKVSSLNYMFDCKNLTSLKLGVNFKPNIQYINFLGVTYNNNLNLNMSGNTDFSSYTSTSTLCLEKLWNNADATAINNFISFVNSLGVCSSSYSRIIRISSSLYNALSSTQKALLTNKGYQLSYV